MFRQSPGRNQRSKGNKVNHRLQVCFLIAVFFWLIYQVKHSHDKKKEYNEYDGQKGVSTKIASDSDVLKLGRKDLKPNLDETLMTKEEPDKEVGDESAAEQEKNKHVEDEEAEEEAKTEKKDGESEGGREDEIDHDEDVKSDTEVDKEDIMEDTKDKDEDVDHVKENSEVIAGDSTGPLEKENSSADHDVEDETDESTHEAREENYKADDVSSAVSHGSQIKTDEDVLGKSNNFSRSENLERVTDRNTTGVQNAVSLMEEREVVENGHPLDTISHDAVKNLAAGSEDSHLENIAEGATFADVSGLLTDGGVTQGTKPIFSSSTSEAGMDTETSLQTNDSGSNISTKDGTLKSEIPDESQQDPRNISDSTAFLSEKDLQAEAGDEKNVLAE